MRRFIFIIVLILTVSLVKAQNADAIVGKYHLPNKLDVEIYKMDGKYYGKIISLNGFEGGQTKDINNPDKSERSTPLLGKTILKDLEYDKENNEWVDGKMYGPEKGMVFNLKVTEVRKNEIEVVGSKFVMWRTLVWKKI
jgi:uncharacterized protein (DUF2147 family)